MIDSRRSTTRRARALAGVIATATMLVAACGSDNKATSNTSVPASSAATSATTAASVPASSAATTATTAAASVPASGSATTAASGVPANVAAAQAVVAQFTKPPSPPAPTDRPVVGKPVPTGKTIDYISCGTPGCNTEGEALKRIGQILGWTVNSITTDGSPQQVQNAWVQILREKPDGVMSNAFPRSMFNNELLEAKAAGIAVVSVGTTDTAGDGFVYVDGTDFYTQTGELMASWVVANSDGAPKVLYATIPDYPIIAVEDDAFKQSLARQAPDSTLETLTIPLAALGTTAPDLYVSYLRSHPDIKYVVIAFDELYSGVPAALSAAGLTGLKTVTIGSTDTGLQMVETGDMDAEVAFDVQLQLFYVVDALARTFIGEPVPPATPYPKWIMSKGNVAPIEPLYPVTPGLDEYFSHVWGKS